MLINTIHPKDLTIGSWICGNWKNLLTRFVKFSSFANENECYGYNLQKNLLALIFITL